MAVAYVNIVEIGQGVSFVDKEACGGRAVFVSPRPSIRKPGNRIVISKKYISKAVSKLLPKVPTMQKSAAFVHPRKSDRSTAFNYHDRIWLTGLSRLNKQILIWREIHGFSVGTFTFKVLVEAIDDDDLAELLF